MFEDVTVVAVVKEKKTFDCGLHNHNSRKELNWCKESQAKIHTLLMELDHYRIHGTPLDLAIKLAKSAPSRSYIALDERFIGD